MKNSCTVSLNSVKVDLSINFFTITMKNQTPCLTLELYYILFFKKKKIECEIKYGDA